MTSLRTARFVRAALGALLLALIVPTTVSWAQQADYFPATPGMSWTYSNGETQTLGGPRDVLGGSYLILTHYFSGVPVSEEILTFQGGVVTYGTAAGGQVMAYDPPLTVYPPAPLSVGDSWQSTTAVGGLEITLASQVLGLQGVRTPAGRFNALHVRQTTLTNSGGRTVLDLFFVPTVGVVRFVTQDGTQIDLIDVNF